MNTHLLEKFSAEIVSGAASLGVASEQCRGILSSNQAVLLEKHTGRSVGELAILGIQANAKIEQQERNREMVSDTLDP